MSNENNKSNESTQKKSRRESVGFFEAFGLLVSAIGKSCLAVDMMADKVLDTIDVVGEGIDVINKQVKDSMNDAKPIVIKEEAK